MSLALARANLAVLETLDLLEKEERPPTPEEREKLEGWSGWGVMAPAFEPRQRETSWRELGDRIRWLLRPEHYASAMQATPNAFYTTPMVSAAAWRLVRGLGFQGGEVLEPGCGHGAFITSSPADLDIRWTGVESDPTTAKLAELLSPGARIVNRPLEKTALTVSAFDAAIGNVPFANVVPYDPTAPALTLHNYFIWRALQATRPGGLVAVMTSRYTLDARHQNQREEILALGDFLGAIRLPTGAFHELGTDAVVDIVVFRRRLPGAPYSDRGPRWLRPADPTRENGINQYFTERPEMALGEMREAHGYASGITLDVLFDGTKDELAVALGEAVERLVDDARRARLTYQQREKPVDNLVLLADPDGRKEGSFHIEGDKVIQITEGKVRPVERTGPEIRALIHLRDAALALLEAEADPDAPDADFERRRLNQLYDGYVAKWGAVNRCTITEGAPDPDTGQPTYSRRRPPMGGFRQDPDYVTVLSLEAYEDETGEHVKALIMSRRVNQRPIRRTHAENPAEAIALCLDEVGRLEAPTLARLLGVEESALADRLGSLVFTDPQSKQLVPADEYLSGDVRVKLEVARAAAYNDPERWADNVAALEAVIPAELGPGEIKVRLGAPYLLTKDVEDFLKETVGREADVEHERVTATWAVEVSNWHRDQPTARVEWGTARVDAYRLTELALNNQTPVVYDELTDGSKVRNADETLLAQEKQRALQTRFSDWVWEDPQRTDRLVELYNRLFNSVVIRKFDGSHLTFPGMTVGFIPYKHQVDMVFRLLQTPAALCGHAVGAGKTAEMFMAAMSLRRLGLAQKPLIVTPNHLLEQVARDGKRLFPSARILMAGSEDITAERRRLFAARCATGDWDAVVMTHSAFTAIGVPAAIEIEYLEGLIDRYREAAFGCKEYGRTVKRVAKMVSRFTARLEELLRHRTDTGVSFDQLGIDYLMVDESQAYKNLGCPTRMDGFSLKPSKRASDLHMKLSWLRKRNPNGRVGALFTGTPVTNTLVELFVVQTYLQPDRLEELGIDNLDAWAAIFCETETKIEVTPDGAGFRLYTRPSRFTNVPELRRMVAEVADIMTADQLHLARPRTVYDTVVVDPSERLRLYVQHLAKRADKIRGGGVDVREDNMLKVCSDGRKAALDLSLVGLPVETVGKVEALVENVLADWRQGGGA